MHAIIETGGKQYRVAPGDVIVLYSDGLVERRGESLTDGINRLCEHVAGAELSNLEAAADAVIAALVGETPSDDVALVLVRIASLTETQRGPA